MAYTFSRRNFMKGAGVSVLAVASAGLFAGCGGGGTSDSTGNTKGTAAVIPGTTTDSGSVKVTLQGYKKGWDLTGLGILSFLEGIGNKLTESYAGKTWITVRFKVENNTGSPIPMENAGMGMVGNALKAVFTNDYSKIDQLYKMGFTASAANGQVHFAAIGGQFSESGSFDPITSSLAAGKTGYIQLHCILTNSDWNKLTINYKPEKATASTKFTLTKNDVITDF